jgi:tripartite-type tricarboxylate transporter receptor subunit TctC
MMLAILPLIMLLAQDAPNKVPAERLTRVHAEVLKALSSNEVRARFAALGADGVGTTPAAFTAFLKAENEKWAIFLGFSPDFLA